MQITDIETLMLRLPVVLPNGDGLQDVLIIRVHTDVGITGIGEAHTAPLILKSIIEAPVSQMTGQGLRQMLVGEDPMQISRLWQKMYDHTSTFGRRGIVLNAISGIDIALWDIAGKALGVPVWQLLGGKRRDHVRAYASDLTPDTAEEIVALAERHRDAGFTAMKFGWGRLGRNVRSDLAWVEQVRARIGDERDIMVDMGTAIPFDDALWLARALADTGVRFLEEPLSPDDLDGFRALVAASPTPIATGEKETTRFGFRALMEQGGLRIIQPDVARCGGLTEMMRIAALAEVRNVDVIPHCWATDILLVASLHFQATQARAPFQEINVTDNPLRARLTTEPIRVVEGQIAIPDGPGLGVALNEDTLAEFRWEP
ncbi:MAG: mandelate racemase/muconate lactonizing enzyme family protein [Azospirillaceae bacterium]